MITELIVVGTGAYIYKYFKNRDKLLLSKKWDEVMKGSGLKNKDDMYYKLNKIYKTDYGYLCTVSIPPGTDFKKLESIKESIQANLKCLCELEKKDFQDYITAKIVLKPQNEKEFEPVKCKPCELFLGYAATGKLIKINMNKFPHLLIAGVVGTGKSRLVFIILTNLIHNFSEKEIELYITQIRKKDLFKFKYCKQVKWYSESLNDTFLMYKRLDNIIHRREAIIAKEGMENIEEYNKESGKKLKYIYIFAEEFAFYMSDDSDGPGIAEIKAEALSILKNIILTARSVGVFVVTTLQRSTVDNIPSTIKSQMSRVTFRQMSDINSINIIDSVEAVGLPDQEAILFTNEYTRFKTPAINKYIVREFIKDSLDEVPAAPKPEKVNTAAWHIPSLEEWDRIKDSIPLINAPKVIPPGKMEHKNKKRNGIINIEEVKDLAKAKR